MNDNLKTKITAKLDELSDERGRQILDYVSFLESKYNRNRRQPSPIQRIAETVDETLGTSRIVDAASKGTSQLVQAAGRVVDGLAEAGRVVAEELQAGVGPRSAESEESEAEGQEPKPEPDEPSAQAEAASDDASKEGESGA